MSTELDINLIVNIYNQKISTLINQNVILEAKLLSLTEELKKTKNSDNEIIDENKSDKK